jgi:glyoxylase-like metal-dependent hydrolase (beta-lactamase superfamily II)
MKQITDGVFDFSGLIMGHVYLLKDDDGLTIVDAGITSAGDKILKQLGEAGYAPSDVKRIIVTHAHMDHVGSLPQLAAATGAQIIASEVERPYVQGEKPIAAPPKESLGFFDRMMSQPPATMPATSVSRTVSDGEILPDVQHGLQVIFTSGHSPGHISLWHPQRRYLITGDVFFHMPWGVTMPIAAFTTDMAENKRSARRLADLNAHIVMFGHGTPFMQNGGDHLLAKVRKIERQ